MTDSRRKRNKKSVKKYSKLTRITIFKMLVMSIITLIPVFMGGFHPSKIAALVEIFIIFTLGQLITKKIKYVTYFISSTLYLISMVNTAFAIFSGSYVTLIMWNNITNLSALGDSLPLYTVLALLVIILAFLPTVLGLWAKEKLWPKLVVGAGLILLELVMVASPKINTPLESTKQLIVDIKDFNANVEKLKNKNPKKVARIYNEFKRSSVDNGIDTNKKNLNVILILAEGFPDKVLDSENGLSESITPNLDEFSKETINFKNYYNHTAATYRGINGQLTSGYQYSNGDEMGTTQIKKRFKTNVISVQNILDKNGYDTSFVNPEPNQALFSKYLESLDFDEVVSGNSEQLSEIDGHGKVLDDEENYKVVESQMKKSKDKFFISTYTFGTHMGLDAEKKKKGVSGERANTFYYSDYAFGRFWKKFKKSKYYDNTVVIFTTDHTAFVDASFQKAFDTKPDFFVNKVPMMIYYPGVQPQTIDAGGKNSLSLAPTIIDLLGYEQSKNYFLGNSLFSNQVTEFQYRSDIMGGEYSTKDNKIKPIGGDETQEKVNDYFYISMAY